MLLVVAFVVEFAAANFERVVAVVPVVLVAPKCSTLLPEGR